MIKNNPINQANILIFGKFLEKGIILLLYVILARILSKEDYGTFREVFLFISVFTTLFSFGLPVSLTYFLPLQKAHEQKGFLYQTILLLSIIGTAGGIITFLISDYISILFTNQQISLYLKPMSIFLVFYFPTLIFHNLYIALEKSTVIAKYSIIFSISKLVMIISAYYYYMSMDAIYYALILHIFFQFLLSLFLYYKPFKNIKFSFKSFDIKKQFLYALPIGLSGIVLIVTRRVDQFFVASYFNSQDFAIYANGSIEIPFFAIIINSIFSVIMPKLVVGFEKNKLIEISDLIKVAVKRVVLIIHPVLIFLYIFANELIIIIFTAKYQPSVPIFKIYILGEIFRIAGYSYVLISFGKSKEVLRINSISFFLNALLNYIFIIHIGLIGPAIATLITIGCIQLTLILKVKNHLNVKFTSILPFKSIIGTVFLFTVFSLFLKYVDSAYLNNQLSIFFIMLLYFPAYILYLYKFDSDLLTWSNFKNKSG